MRLESGHTGAIVDKGEIHDVLHAALIHRWSFYYLSMVRNHLASHSTRLINLNPEEGVLSVSHELWDALAHSMTNRVYFRARSGGISVLFKSTMILPSQGTTLIGKPKLCDFEYPDSVRYSQLRKAIRINLADSQDIPVTLFVKLGVLHQGKVIDISETGAKIAFSGDLTARLSGSEIVTDCQMLLPDDTCIENRARILGVTYDKDTDRSFLRCEYLETSLNSEVRLKQLIADAIDSMETEVLPLAM